MATVPISPCSSQSAARPIPMRSLRREERASNPTQSREFGISRRVAHGFVPSRMTHPEPTSSGRRDTSLCSPTAAPTLTRRCTGCS